MIQYVFIFSFKNVYKNFNDVCIIFISKLYIILLSIMIKTENISNVLKANNTLIVAADKFNTITVSD